MGPILTAREAAFRYAQHSHGLAPISLSVEAGEQLLIAGPSGCGKSTLARCLTGLIPHLYRGALEGEVWLDGHRTADTDLWRLAERAGLVFQNPAAQSLAHAVDEEIIFGLENLGLGREAITERLEAILARFGLETMRDRSPQTLSGGEQQKLALAAITAREPAVLVLDEPLSMLDSTAALELVAHLAKLAHAGTTVITCEHREEYLQGLPELRTLRLAGAAPAIRGTSAPRPHAADAIAGRLDVQGLTVSLGGRAVLRDLTFSLDAGQVVAIVGRNGVGKTTLLRALAGLQPHEGVVSMNGSRPDLGLVFQNANLQLFNATVREEILFRVPEPDMALYEWLLAALCLASYEQLPPLLLSEGEMKRVALATVLMRQPRDGVLLDEPSLGQDAAHKALLIHLARSLADAGQLVILTTHDLPLAVQADRLMLLGPQGFVADGPPGRVLCDDSAWAALGLTVPAWVAVPSGPAPCPIQPGGDGRSEATT